MAITDSNLSEAVNNTLGPDGTTENDHGTEYKHDTDQDTSTDPALSKYIILL